MVEPYYKCDDVTIYHGDCADILWDIGPADLMLTDPPYGIGEAAGKNSSRGDRTIAPTAFATKDWDNVPPNDAVLQQCIDAAPLSIIWGGNYFGLLAASKWLVWDKDNDATDFADAELAWTNVGGAVRTFRWRWNGMLQGHYHGNDPRKEKRVHPTQKPVPLMRWCLSHAPDAAVVLDPFAGSGTTGVACRLEGRRAILIEREEEYCEAAAKRLAGTVMLPGLLE